MATGRELWLVCSESFTQHFLPPQIKYHEEFEKSRMGPSGGEGLEPERRDSQDSSSYRRPQEQQPPPHHIPASAPGEREAWGGRGPETRPAVAWGGGRREAWSTCTPMRVLTQTLRSVPPGASRTRVRVYAGSPVCWQRPAPGVEDARLADVRTDIEA